MKLKMLPLMGLAFVSLLNSCGEQGNTTAKKQGGEPVPRTSIEFDTLFHDFGRIEQGEKVTHYFTYKNTGDNPLIVTQVQPSCGCTVPDWTQDPVKPGEEGKVQVLFNSTGREGKQHKSVTVVANTNPPTINLEFTAEVKAQKK